MPNGEGVVNPPVDMGIQAPNDRRKAELSCQDGRIYRYLTEIAKNITMPVWTHGSLGHLPASGCNPRTTEKSVDCPGFDGAGKDQEEVPGRSVHSREAHKRQTPEGCRLRGFGFRSPAVSYSHMGSPTLPSALSSFTSEFGMGSGGSRSLWPPGKSARAPLLQNTRIRQVCKAGRANSHQHPAVGYSQTAWVLYGQASRTISTG